MDDSTTDAGGPAPRRAGATSPQRTAKIPKAPPPSETATGETATSETAPGEPATAGGTPTKKGAAKRTAAASSRTETTSRALPRQPKLEPAHNIVKSPTTRPAPKQIPAQRHGLPSVVEQPREQLEIPLPLPTPTKEPTPAHEPTPSREPTPSKAPSKAPSKGPSKASSQALSEVSSKEPSPREPSQSREPTASKQSPAKAAAPTSGAALTERPGSGEPGRATNAEIPLWAHLVADPGFAPEHIARAAVRRLGPAAAVWVARVRDRYPDASPDALARLATAELTRTARSAGAIGGAGGALGSLLTTTSIQARLVLTIAAAYGEDPTGEERVRDLLALLRVPRLTEPARPALAHAASIVARVVVRGLAARAMTFGGAIAGAVQGARATQDVAARAVDHYRSNGARTVT